MTTQFAIPEGFHDFIANHARGENISNDREGYAHFKTALAAADAPLVERFNAEWGLYAEHGLRPVPFRFADILVLLTTDADGNLLVVDDLRDYDERGEADEEFERLYGSDALDSMTGEFALKSPSLLSINGNADSKPGDAKSPFIGPRVLGGFEDYVVNNLGDTGDGWFPKGEISLIAGSSGAGKSTLMLDWLATQAEGELVLGHKTNSLPYLVFMADRSAKSLKRTAKRMRLDLDTLPHVMLRPGPDVLRRIDEALNKQSRMPEVIFLEGIDMLAGDSVDPERVVALLDGIATLAEHYHIAVIGSTGTPKIKRNEGFKAKRDNIIGSSLWARKAETVVLVIFEDKEMRNYVDVMPRNAAPETFVMKMVEGRLVAESPLAQAAAAEREMESAAHVWMLDRNTFTMNALRKAFPKMSGKVARRKVEQALDWKRIEPITTKGGKVTGYSVPENVVKPTEERQAPTNDRGVAIRDEDVPDFA